ncbi:hypothetical protein [Endozoicomonas elysicola]|uniref:Uncharacterized protein n=1 Tax=Endozoicomonas elysicola TaxID=305900 RepID=A0A081KDH6_9GAMM|nr:hypothetical protein [Endozoicomonas elysicola]KEI72202.1 hypothetical protein GV64_17025 [Endozoicomonas elysicola]
MIIRIATTMTLIAGLAISAASAIANEKRVTGGDNAYYISEHSGQTFSSVDFSWPESQFKGGDGYNGPVESKAFKAYVIHEEKKGGDNQ